jgi:hypothetical protein
MHAARDLLQHANLHLGCPMQLNSLLIVRPALACQRIARACALQFERAAATKVNARDPVCLICFNNAVHVLCACLHSPVFTCSEDPLQPAVVKDRHNLEADPRYRR